MPRRVQVSMVPSDKLLWKLKIKAEEILIDKLPGEELGIYIYRVRSLEYWLASASGAPTKNPDVGTQFTSVQEGSQIFSL
jgi:hypothetical protein